MSSNAAMREMNAKQREPRLSPELDELLHMLDALESQYSAPQFKTAGKR